MANKNSSLADALAEGLKIGVQMKQAKIMQMNAMQNALKEKREAADSQRQMEINQQRADTEKEGRDLEIGKETLKRLSQTMMNWDDQKKAMFYQTPAGQAVLKDLKSRLPAGFFDENGQPILMADKDMFEADLKKAELQEKQGMEIIRQKMLNGTASDTETMIAMANEKYGGLTKAAYEIAKDNDDWSKPEMRGKILRDSVQMLIKSFNTNPDQQPTEEPASNGGGILSSVLAKLATSPMAAGVTGEAAKYAPALTGQTVPTTSRVLATPQPSNIDINSQPTFKRLQ